MSKSPALCVSVKRNDCHPILWNRAMNIKHVLCYDTLTAESVPFVAEKLAMTVSRGGQVPYALIWRHWPELNELYGERFTSYGEEGTSERSENLDSEFCGIFPAEVALLREQDDEYLRAVCVVPVMPTVNCLRLLRNLRIIRRYYGPCRIPNEEVDPIFSKVAALIAFQRYRELCVDVQTNSQKMLNVLNHLRRYAAVQLYEREIESFRLP